MKKFLFYSSFIFLFFLAACDNSEKAEVKTENGTTVKEPVPNTIVDTSKAVGKDVKTEVKK